MTMTNSRKIKSKIKKEMKDMILCVFRSKVATDSGGSLPPLKRCTGKDN